MKLYTIPTWGVLLLLGVTALTSSLYIDGQFSTPQASSHEKEAVVAKVVTQVQAPSLASVVRQRVTTPVPRVQVPPRPPVLTTVAFQPSHLVMGSDCSIAGDQRKNWWPRVPEIAHCIRSKYGHSLQQAVNEYGLPEQMIIAIIIKESEGDPKKISSTGCCVGLMQIDRGTTAREYGLDPARLLEPHENILGGAKVLAAYARRAGSLDTGLMWYFAGPAGPMENAPDYVARVKKIMAVI